MSHRSLQELMAGLVWAALILEGCRTRPAIAVGQSTILSSSAVKDQDGGAAGDPARALDLFESGCDKNDFASCVELGRLYDLGIGAPVELPRAAVLYDMGCRHDVSRGCERLATLYETGRGVPSHAKRAAELRTLAAQVAAGRRAAAVHPGRVAGTDAGVPPPGGRERAREGFERAMARGREETRAQHPHRAIAAFEQALEQLPDDPHALSEKGYAETIAGSRYAEVAQRDLNAALNLVPESDKALRAEVYLNLSAVAASAGGRRRLQVESYRALPRPSLEQTIHECPLRHTLHGVRLFESALAAQQEMGRPTTSTVEPESAASAPHFERKEDGTLETEGLLLLPLSNKKLVAFENGSFSGGRCAAEIDTAAKLEDGVWVVHVSDRSGFPTQHVTGCGSHDCEDAALDLGDPDDPEDPRMAKDICYCRAPWGQFGCPSSDEATTVRVYAIDQTTGIVLDTIDSDPSFEPDYAVRYDRKTRHLVVAGVGCDDPKRGASTPP